MFILQFILSSCGTLGLSLIDVPTFKNECVLRRYNTSARLSAPSFGLDLTFTTYIADNEIMLGPVPFIYEGVASVVGTHLGSPVAGNGFVEWFLYAGDNMFQV